MTTSTVVARVLDGDRLECVVTPPEGQPLTLSGAATDAIPQFEPSGLGAHAFLVDHAWAYALSRFQAVNLPDHEQQQNAEKRAEEARKVSVWVADLADNLGDEEKFGWCSACIKQRVHRKVKQTIGNFPAYLCSGCGTPTWSCAGIGCKNMAVRDRTALKMQPYCAEHRHDIPGFAKADGKLAALNEYEEFLAYDKPNLARNTKMAGVIGAGVAMATPLAYFGAPVIGGAVGALVGGYSGAAATSFGLALLGGGSLAAGGLGMVGGTYVVAGLGAALGGSLGASVMNAYLQQDKSFHIEMLKDGTGVPVVVCNGFLSESGKGWGEWKTIVTSRYPDSPVYRVHWGARELRHLRLLGANGAAGALGMAAVKNAAARAAQEAAKKIHAVAPAFIAADLAKNPWHVAKNRADKTGVILADLLARTDEDSYVLIGHSLGARAMVVAAQALGTKRDAPRVHAAHLLGPAISAKGDWHSLTATVDEAVYNYHSKRDLILQGLYPVGAGFQAAAGCSGFHPAVDRLRNIDVSHIVKSHHDYHQNVILEGGAASSSSTSAQTGSSEDEGPVPVDV
jgi:pimeloyl-ACP methyl ester carboxylesterase